MALITPLPQRADTWQIFRPESLYAYVASFRLLLSTSPCNIAFTVGSMHKIIAIIAVRVAWLRPHLCLVSEASQDDMPPYADRYALREPSQVRCVLTHYVFRLQLRWASIG